MVRENIKEKKQIVFPIWLLVLALGSCFGLSQLVAQDALKDKKATIKLGPAVNPLESRIKIGLLSRVETELSLMSQYDENLTDKQVESLRKLAVRHVSSSLRELFTANPKFSVLSFHVLPNDIQQGMIADAKALVGEDRLVAYCEAERIHRSLARRTAEANLLLAFDRMSALSSQQQNAIRKILQDSWQIGWTQMAWQIRKEFNYRPMMQKILMQVPLDKMKKVLRPAQFAALDDRDLNKALFLQFVAIQPGFSEQGQWAQSVRNRCKKSISLKIEELNDLLSLNANQIKILNIAGKGATIRFVRQTTDAMKKIQENQDALNIDWRTRVLLAGNPETRLWDDSRWQQAIDKILDEFQSELYAKRQTERENLAHESSSISRVFYLLRWIQLSGKQQNDLTAMLMESKKPAKEFSIYNLGLDFPGIPNEKFQQILDEQQWGQFLEIRQRYEQRAKT